MATINESGQQMLSSVNQPPIMLQQGTSKCPLCGADVGCLMHICGNTPTHLNHRNEFPDVGYIERLQRAGGVCCLLLLLACAGCQNSPTLATPSAHKPPANDGMHSIVVLPEKAESRISELEAKYRLLESRTIELSRKVAALESKAHAHAATKPPSGLINDVHKYTLELDRKIEKYHKIAMEFAIETANELDNRCPRKEPTVPAAAYQVQPSHHGSHR